MAQKLGCLEGNSAHIALMRAIARQRVKNNFGAVWGISLEVHGPLNFQKNQKNAKIRSVRSTRVRSVRVRMRGTK